MRRHVVEEVDFEADGNGLAEVGGQPLVYLPGAKFGEGFVAREGWFDPDADDRGVEVKDGAQPNLDAKRDVGLGKRFALEDPATAVAAGCGEAGEEAVALFITESLDVERFHGSFIGDKVPQRDGVGYCGHVTDAGWKLALHDYDGEGGVFAVG